MFLSVTIVLIWTILTTFASTTFENSNASSYMTPREWRSANLNNNLYYASATSGDWEAGIQDCIYTFGPEAHLLSIQTEEEQEYINGWLQSSSGGGGVYWTSGAYTPEVDEWLWRRTNESTSRYRNWAPDEPKTSNLHQRIALNHQNQFSSHWISADDSQLNRYVCELTVTGPEEPIPCQAPSDFVILMDSSGSIGADHFGELRSFVALLASAFTSEPNSRVSVIAFSEEVVTVVELINDLTPDQIADAIFSMQYLDGSTNTDLGIIEGTRALNSNARPEPRTFIVITDGISNYPNQTEIAADAAVASGIRTFSLGVTDYVSYEELLTIAGGDPEHLFSAPHWSDLNGLLAPLTEALCPT